MSHWLFHAAWLSTWAFYTTVFWMTFVHILLDHRAADTAWEWVAAVVMSFSGALLWPLYWPYCH